jgi:hypothetical protein
MKTKLFLFISASAIAATGIFGYAGPAEPKSNDNKSRVPVISQGYGSLPLSFELNSGQTDPNVKFLSRGKAYTLFLTANEAVLTLQVPHMEDEEQERLDFREHRRREHPSNNMENSVLRMQIAGANPKPLVGGLEKLPGKVNYFLGNKPGKWLTDIPLYRRVRYRDVYPGIDLVFYGFQQHLEWDFVVSPAANPGDIRLDFKGAERLDLDCSGKVILSMGPGKITLNPPVIYQEIDHTRRIVPGEYVLRGKNSIGFQVAPYDTDKPLVIDPVLTYSTFLGGSQNEMGRGIAVDHAGNAYVTGMTPSSNFPITAGSYSNSHNGNGDVFVTKLNSSGSGLIYSTYLGGSDYDWAHSIVLDADNNAYVTGYTHSFNFPTTDGAFQTIKGGGASNIEDAFVTKLNATGSALSYSTFIGGDQADWGEGIALDSTGNAYITGVTWSSVFPTTEGALDELYHGNGDVFVSKLNSSGTSLVYSTYIGGALTEYGFGIAVDLNNHAYITGRTNSNPFPTTVGAFQTISNGGNQEAFVSKLSPAGDSLVYSTYLGGSGWDFAHGIVIDSVGNAYLAGGTASFDFPITNPLQGTNNGPICAFPGCGDAFVAIMNSNGSSLLYSTFIGGLAMDEGHGIDLDGKGNIYVVGFTYSSDFPTVNAVQKEICQGCTNVSSADAFITKLSPSGAAFIYSTYLGGILYDWAHAVAVDSSGSAYVVGDSSSENFPVTSGAYQQILQLDDAYVAKIEDFSPNVPSSFILLLGD